MPAIFKHTTSYSLDILNVVIYFACRVKLIAYTCSPTQDSKTELLKAAVEDSGGKWTEVLHMSEQELAALVQEDEVDILVELTGHTANNRLGVMAQRPAPIQVSAAVLNIQ